MDERKRFGYEYANSDRYMILREFARQNRFHSTLAEKLLWEALKGDFKSFRFRRQHIIGDFIVDFACLLNLLVIEVDGGYHSEPKQENEDLLRSQILEKKGFRVIRFTNEEIEDNIQDVINQIKAILYNED